MNLKEILGKKIASEIKDNSIIGVGTGTTVDCAILEIAKRVKEENLKVFVIPTSLATTRLCMKQGLIVLSDIMPESIDFSFDGADAVDNKRRLIKGKGGAVVREKILASVSKKYVILADETKFQDDIANITVPIEVRPISIYAVQKNLKKIFDIESMEIRMAQKKHGEILTEAGNLILDVKFKKIENNYECKLNNIPGVVENGIFTKYATKVLISKSDGSILEI